MQLSDFEGRPCEVGSRRPGPNSAPNALVLSTSLVPASGLRGLMNAREVEITAAVERRVSDVRQLRQGIRPLEEAVVGSIAHDPAVRDAILVQRLIIDHLTHLAASRCFRTLALRLAGIEPTQTDGLRLVASSQPRRAAAAETPQCA
jgi:hypothetical protein